MSSIVSQFPILHKKNFFVYICTSITTSYFNHYLRDYTASKLSLQSPQRLENHFMYSFFSLYALCKYPAAGSVVRAGQRESQQRGCALQLHLINSLLAFATSGNVVQTGFHEFSLFVQPYPSGSGTFCISCRLVVQILAWNRALLEWCRRAKSS